MVVSDLFVLSIESYMLEKQRWKRSECEMGEKLMSIEKLRKTFFFDFCFMERKRWRFPDVTD